MGVASHTTEKSTRTSSSSRVASWEPERDQLSSGNQSSQPPRHGKMRRSKSNSSIHPPRWVMVASRLPKKRTEFSDHLLASREKPKTESCDYVIARDDAESRTLN